MIVNIIVTLKSIAMVGFVLKVNMKASLSTKGTIRSGPSMPI